MIIKVDPVRGTASLEDPADLAGFKVLVVGDGDAGSALRSFGRLDGDHAWVEIDAIKAAAAGRVPDSWIDDFAAMVELASARGWINEAQTELRAHVEHVAAPPEKTRRFLR